MCEGANDGADGMSRGGTSKACLSCVSMGVRQMERGNIGPRERTCVAINGRMGGRLRCGFIYAYLYR